MSPRFFPYRPSALRGLLAALATVALAAGASAAPYGLQGRPAAAVRAILATSLALGFVWLVWRLRPRAGYGIRLDLAGVELVRPLDGRAERLLWPQLVRVQQVGRAWPRWVLALEDGTQREVPRALFSDPAIWRDLGRALGPSEGRFSADA